jgi:hypothetical protein
VVPLRRAPAGAEVARRAGAAGGAPTPSPTPRRERLSSNAADERGIRPTWPDESGFRSTASWSRCAEARLDGAAGGSPRPSPGPDERAFRPTRQTRAPFVQPARTNVAFVQLRAGRCGLKRDRTAPPAAVEWPARPVWPDERATRPAPSQRAGRAARGNTRTSGQHGRRGGASTNERFDCGQMYTSALTRALMYISEAGGAVLAPARRSVEQTPAFRPCSPRTWAGTMG